MTVFSSILQWRKLLATLYLLASRDRQAALIPHSFEGVEGIKGRHRLAELDETETADGIAVALQETLKRIKSGEEGIEAVTDLLMASCHLHCQIDTQKPSEKSLVSLC